MARETGPALERPNQLVVGLVKPRTRNTKPRRIRFLCIARESLAKHVACPYAMDPPQSLRYGPRVMSRPCLRSLVLFCVVTTACAETLDIPPAPEFDEVLNAYENPSAEVTSEVMAEVGDDILELRNQLEESDVFEELLDVIVSVQEELDEATDEEGNLFGEFPTPDGFVEINHTCEGWDSTGADEDTETGGVLQLNMVLRGGDIDPIVWGEAAQCRFLTVLADRVSRTSYDGEVSVHFGAAAIPTDQLLRDLVITFIVSGTLGVEDLTLPIRQSFQVRGSGRLDVLVELSNRRTFVYFFDLEPLRQGVKDATGTFTCSLEDRQCISRGFSW